MNERLHRALAPAIVLAALWAELLLFRTTAGVSLFVAAGLAIAVGALYGGVWVGVAAVVTSVVAFDYLILEPGTLLTFGRPAQAVALAVFSGGWLMVAALLHRLHAQVARDQEMRLAAEAGAEHADRIAQLTAALGRARTSHAAIESAVQEPLHALHADAAMLALVSDDGSRATVVRAVGYDPLLPASDPLIPLGPGPLRDTVRRAAPVILETPAARAMEYGDAATDPLTARFTALAVVPLVITGHVRAVIRLDFARPRTFTPLDHQYVEALASHAAHALERTWEQEAHQRARIGAEELRARADQELARRQATEQALRASETRYRALATRTTRLHGLTAALSEAVTTRAVATAIVQHATIVVGATAGEVWLLSDDRMHFDTLEGSDPGAAAARVPVEPGLCEADVIATRRPLFIRSWDESQERYWRSASAAADAAYVSSSALPLLVDGLPAGVLRFDFSVPVNFDEEYQSLLISVAQHCSQALDRARLYESAQRARAEAEAASRLKDDFLSIVSHELRTPLNAVLGWASMLQKGPVETSLGRRAVQSIHDNASRQAQLIDDLLDISRIAAGRATLDRQDFDLGTLVAGVVESLTPVAVSHGVELRTEPLPAATITGDRRRLEQVFFNLVGNALKFTPAGGWVFIDAALAPGIVEIRVKDNGIGIEPAFLPHVFERFRQADSTSARTYGGLGLGLAIAKQLVEAHQGSIAVDSPGVGQGAVFTVQLPLAAAPALRAPVGPPAAAGLPAADVPRLDGVQVLIVDDEADAREIIGYALQALGARVTLASSAQEAFDRILSAPFDVLVADIAMPGEDGCSLMRRVRNHREPRVACIPAAAVTAHARFEERQHVLAAGFHVHLAKPIEPDALARAVHDLTRSATV